MNDDRETAGEEWVIAGYIEGEIAMREQFCASLDKHEARLARKLTYVDQIIFRDEIEPIHVELQAALSACLYDFDDPEANATAHARFDAALVCLGEAYRDFDADWEGWVNSPHHLFRHLPEMIADVWRTSCD